jgi:MarR family 2-MHQ and catechol resistance regulon transcriptional repressor
MNMATNVEGIHLWLVLWRAASAVAGHARRHIETLGLGTSDFAVLEALYHKGSLPVNAIGRKVLLASGSITPAVDRLERQGLVRRAPDPNDRRVRVVHLTRAGRKLIQKSLPAHREAMERAVAGLTAEERDTLTALLKKLGHRAEETIPPKGTES